MNSATRPIGPAGTAKPAGRQDDANRQHKTPNADMQEQDAGTADSGAVEGTDGAEAAKQTVKPPGKTGIDDAKAR